MTDETRDPPKPLELWRHCKGTVYEIVTLAMHSESGEPMVIYRKAKDPVATGWARPLTMFMDRHDTGVLRFERVGTIADAFRHRLVEMKELVAEVSSDSGLTIVDDETFDRLLEMLDKPPEVSAEARAAFANRRWR